MSEHVEEATQRKKQRRSSGEEDPRKTAWLTTNLACPRSKSQTMQELRKSMSQGASAEKKISQQPPKARRKTIAEKHVAKLNNRKQDGPACPVCEAVFKTADLITLHFNRAHHTEKRVRRKTELFVARSLMCATKASKSSNSKRKQTADELAQIQPKAKRTRVDLKAQNRPPLARQSSAVAKARSGTSLKGSTAQLRPDKDTQRVGEGSPSEVKRNLLPASVVDCDQENRADNIIEHLKQRESFYEIKYYISLQSELGRPELVNRMVEFQEVQDLNSETLFLGVKIIDAYLGKKRVATNRLLMLGAVAMWLASNYAEHKTFDINKLLDISDDRHKQQEVRKMEESVLREINFDLGFPLSIEFLRRYAQCSNASTPLLMLASYILEFSLMFFSFIRVKSSKMACAALFMARRMNDQEGWSATLEQCSGYKVKDFAQIVKHLDKLLRKAPAEDTQKLKLKYSQVDHYKVAKIPLKNINSLFEDYPDVLA